MMDPAYFKNSKAAIRRELIPIHSSTPKKNALVHRQSELVLDHQFGFYAIDTILNYLGLLDVISCLLVCDESNRKKTDRSKIYCGNRFELARGPSGIYGRVDQKTYIDQVNEIFENYGPQMRKLKADYNLFVDKHSITKISQLIKDNCVNLEHYDFFGSCYYPDISDQYVPDLCRLKSLWMKNFTKYTDDRIVGSYLRKAFESLESLALEQMWLTGKCLEAAPPVQSLVLKQLHKLDLKYVRRFFDRCPELRYFELELPGYVQTKLFNPNNIELRTLKIKLNNRFRWMDVLDVGLISKYPKLTKLELMVKKMKNLDTLICKLAKRDIIEHLALNLEEFLLDETIFSLSGFSKMSSLKLECSQPHMMIQLDLIYTQLSNRTQITHFELISDTVDLRGLCQYMVYIQHIRLRINGPCTNANLIASLPRLRSADMTFLIHAHFFDSKHEHYTDIAQLISLFVGNFPCHRVVFHFLTSDAYFEDEISLFRVFARAADIHFERIHEDLFELGHINNGIKFEFKNTQLLPEKINHLLGIAKEQQTRVKLIRMYVEKKQ